MTVAILYLTLSKGYWGH